MKKGHYALVTTSIYLDLIGKIPKIFSSLKNDVFLNHVTIYSNYYSKFYLPTGTTKSGLKLSSSNPRREQIVLLSSIGNRLLDRPHAVASKKVL